MEFFKGVGRLLSIFSLGCIEMGTVGGERVLCRTSLGVVLAAESQLHIMAIRHEASMWGRPGFKVNPRRIQNRIFFLLKF